MPHTLNTHLALYADYTAFLAQSCRTDSILHRLNHATSVLLRYFARWKFQINIHKTEGILFTRRRPVPPAPLHFLHTVIPWNSQVRYLGLLLNSKLLFTSYITSAIHKATRPPVSSSISSLSSHAIQHCPFPIKSHISIYLSALYSHTLLLFAATHHPQLSPTATFTVQTSPRYWQLPQAHLHPASSCHPKRHAYP